MADVFHVRGKTYHGRKGPVRNAFTYGIDYVLLDAEAEVRGPWLFSRRRRAIAQVRDADHGGPVGAGQGVAWARSVFRAQGVPVDGRIMLLAQPRLLAHIFNPVSFWLGYDRQSRLIAVIAEVTNTYGDRHSYLCHTHDFRPLDADTEVRARKVFHVSPFQPTDGDYAFRFGIERDEIAIRIDYGRKAGGLVATLSGSVRPLTNLGILGALVRRPLGSRRVTALIHWQALKLWWKGARFRSRPEPPKADVSR